MSALHLGVMWTPIYPMLLGSLDMSVGPRST